MWDKYERLKGILSGMGRVVVAFSGGVDSTLLLKAATEALDGDATGVTVVSPLLSSKDYEDAVALGKVLGAEVATIKIPDLDDPRIVGNSANRCYFCKATICAHLQAFATEHRFDAIIDGANLDDLDDYRPGQRAAQECGMRSPLQEAGLTKDDIRALSRELGLPTWDKPSAACLASRVPYGTPITQGVLTRIDRAEQSLKLLGFTELRVRHHDTVARIEVPTSDFHRVWEQRQRIVEVLQAVGYPYVTLDLGGFRSGSMNEVVETNGR